MGELQDKVEKLADTRPDIAPELRKVLASGLSLEGRVGAVKLQFVTEVITLVGQLLIKKARTTKGVGFQYLNTDTWEGEWTTPVPGTFNDTPLKLSLYLNDPQIQLMVTTSFGGPSHKDAVPWTSTPDKTAARAWRSILRVLEDLAH